MTAIRRGAIAASTEEPTAAYSADMRSMNNPVAMFSATPTITLGRILMDACNAERPWTCWKLHSISYVKIDMHYSTYNKLEKNSTATVAPILAKSGRQYGTCLEISWIHTKNHDTNARERFSLPE